MHADVLSLLLGYMCSAVVSRIYTELECAFRSSADNIVVVTHRALLSALPADNRNPTIGVGDPLLSVIVGCYCQFIKAVNNILRITLHSRSFARPPLFDNNLVCLASYDSSRTTPDNFSGASMLPKCSNAFLPRRAINDSSTNSTRSLHLTLDLLRVWK